MNATLKLEAACSSEIFVSAYKTVRCHNSEDHDLKDARFGISGEFGVSSEVDQSKFRSMRTHVQKNKITRRKSESEDVNIESAWFAFVHMELILRTAVQGKGEDSKQSIPSIP
jgi:hypothetical protein